MTPIELFERWYGRAIDKLRELPSKDGAFAALMIALPLYERYIIAKLKLDGKTTTDDEVKQEICSDLSLLDHERRIFWEMFRNGFTHQAMAMDGKTKWMVSHKFTELPEFKTIQGIRCVCFDPWKFTDRVLNKFRADSRLITESESFPWASVFAMPAELSPQGPSA